MSPEKAKVFIVEDSGSFIRKYGEKLTVYGHEVVMVATTKREAIEMSHQLLELGVKVALIDGNLDIHAPDYGHGNDGREVANKIRENAPGVITVGMSFDPDGVRGVDVNLGKMRANELGKFIEDL